jgi:transcriptional regulator with XRE-family HTH domain
LASPFTPPREAREALGRKIRKVRKEIRGRSLNWLAEQVGTSRQHLIRLEKGDHWPSEHLLTAIADALDTPVSYFVGEPSDAHRERLEQALRSLADELYDIAREAAESAAAAERPPSSRGARRSVA